MTPEEVVTRYHNFARYRARRMSGLYGSHIEFEDMFQVALMALFEAASSWDESKSSLITYIVNRMDWAMLEYVRSHDHLTRSHRRVVGPDHESFRPYSLDEMREYGFDRSDGDNAIDRFIERITDQQAAHKFYLWYRKHYPRSDRNLVAMRLHCDGFTMVEIAMVLGITEAGVSYAIQRVENAAKDFTRLFFAE